MVPFCCTLFVACDNDVIAQPQLLMQDTVNWGVVIPEGDPGATASVSADVKLSNGGSEMLRITEVRPSCGCTTAPLDKDSLARGEETTMRIKLNLPSHNGLVQKTITVSSNDPMNPQKVLHLIADVQRPLQMSSSFVPFNRGKVGSSIEGSITFTVKGKESVTIRATSADAGFVIETPMPINLKSGESAEMKITHKPTKTGSFKGQFEIETNLKGYEKMTIYGYGSADP